MRLIAVVLVVLLFVGACGSATSSEPPVVAEPRPAATAVPANPTPTPTPTPAAEPSTTASSTPPADLARSATVERDGIRVTLTLERNPMPAGEPTWMDLEVRNVGQDDVLWLHDGCATAVGVFGRMDGVRYRFGDAQDRPVAADFQRRALESARIDDGVIWIDFTPEWYIGREGYGCLDLAIKDRIAPGESLAGRARWDGRAGFRLLPPPTGRVPLVGRAAHFWRSSAGDVDTSRDVIEVPLEAWIVAPEAPASLDPAEIVDIALDVPGFYATVASRISFPGVSPILRTRADGMWEVGVVWDAASTFHGVTVDPLTGEPSDVFERSWDFDRDGYP